jgi:hypothetical protein
MVRRNDPLKVLFIGNSFTARNDLPGLIAGLALARETVLYMTWARQHAPESQQSITDAYCGIGRELGASVVPVGVAWQSFLRKHESYLAACVFLGTLFRECPVGIEGADLGKKDRILLQKVAWQACKNFTAARSK